MFGKYRLFISVVVFVVVLLLAAPVLAQGGPELQDFPIPAPSDIPALLNEIVNKLIVLALTALAAALPILWQRAKVWAYRQYEQFPAEIRRTLEDVALVAARFVEQLDLTDQLVSGLENLAQARMETAVNYGVTLLEAQGYTVTTQTQGALQGLIENVILAGRHKKAAALEDARIVEVEVLAEPVLPPTSPSAIRGPGRRRTTMWAGSCSGLKHLSEPVNRCRFSSSASLVSTALPTGTSRVTRLRRGALTGRFMT